MNLATAVLEDLYTFARRKVSGEIRTNAVSSSLLLNPSREIVESKDPLLTHPAQSEARAPRTMPSGPAIAMPGAVAPRTTAPAPAKNTVMYVSSMYTTLRSEPSILRDTNLGTIPYGTMVMVLDSNNGWAKVLRGEDEGWVETSDLADRAAYILPQFVKGEANGEDDPNTIRLRAIINDEFSCGAAGLPLQAHEYILYKLMRKNIKVKWPKIRPRTPGRWADILVHGGNAALSVQPKSGSVMEFFTDDSIGRLVFVEAVFPDGAIQTSEGNWPDEGVYNERVMKKEEWEALSPVFITFS